MRAHDSQQLGSAADNDPTVIFEDATISIPPVNNFDIAQAAIDFLRKCNDNPLNQSITYEKVQGVFDAYPDFRGVCEALAGERVQFTAKHFAYETFSQRELSDPTKRLPQYDSDSDNGSD